LTSDSNNVSFLLPYGHDTDNARVTGNNFIEDPEVSDS
jgi:hypothetical protein